MSSIMYAVAGAVAGFGLIVLLALAVYDCWCDYQQASRNRQDREREARIDAYRERLAALRRVTYRQMIEDWQDRPSIPSNDWRKR